MANSKKVKGYGLERYCVLTLEYNGYHVKRNALSYGIEDVIAFKSMSKPLLIQVKNTLVGKNSMTKEEQLVLKRHAMELEAIPIFLFSENRKKIWVNLITNDYFEIKPFTIEWYNNRQLIKNQLRELNNKSKSLYNKYVLENWETVHQFIC